MAKILTIIPYHFYPPVNGGSARSFYIMREMAKLHDVYVLTIQPKEDFEGDQEPLFPANVHILSLSNAAPYRSIFNILSRKLANAIHYRLLKRSWFSPTNSYFLNAYPLLVKALKNISPAIVYYENLEAVGFFSDIAKKQLPTAKQVYDAHNVDSELWEQLAIAQNNPLLKKYAVTALKTEKNLDAILDGVFCCSVNDQQKMLDLNDGQLKTWIVPNGVDSHAKAFDQNPEKYCSKEILFCGSLDYYPNEQGLFWFYNNIFPLIKKVMPNVKLTLVGTTASNESYQLLQNDPSVQFEGRVNDVAPFYYRASICIAPLLSGSGTRLKILEAMSFGSPVVSTSMGAKGIEAIAGTHLLIADEPSAFAQAVIDLFGDKNLFNAIRRMALQLIQEKYEWEKTGILINTLLSGLAEG